MNAEITGTRFAPISVRIVLSATTTPVILRCAQNDRRGGE
jgi:hypothetical protein